MRKLASIVSAAIIVACTGNDQLGDSDALLVTAVAAGSGFTCALHSDSTAWCWGANQYGQLGTASSADTCKVDPVATGSCGARPVAVAGARKFTAIDAGESHACALTHDGQAFCWGDNASGQLGNADSAGSCSVEYYEQRGYGATPCAHAPRAVKTALRFASITAASGFTCALTREGVAYCWGKWTNGRFDAAAASIPGGPIARINAPESFTQISADGGRACAITSAGRVWCWGGGVVTPTPISTDLRFVSVSRGWRHTCGIARDSTAYCWGENDSGQLGDATVNPRFNSGDSTIHRVADNLRFRAIDAGFLSTCGATIDGKLYCWGDGSVVGAPANDRCAHAGASSVCALRPVRTPLNDVVAMTSGFTHRCARLANGRAFCWGNNESHAASADTSRMISAPTVVKR